MSGEIPINPPGKPPRLVSCPACGASVPWVPESRWRPFCSQRCRTLDLGAWATEQYRIPEAEASDGGEELT